MDVKDLAPALLALGALCEDANRLLNSDRAHVAVRVQAVKPGSFHVSLDIWQELKTIFTGDNVETAESVLKLLGLIVGGGGGDHWCTKTGTIAKRKTGHRRHA